MILKRDNSIYKSWKQSIAHKRTSESGCFKSRALDRTPPIISFNFWDILMLILTIQKPYGCGRKTLNKKISNKIRGISKSYRKIRTLWRLHVCLYCILVWLMEKLWKANRPVTAMDDWTIIGKWTTWGCRIWPQ